MRDRNEGQRRGREGRDLGPRLAQKVVEGKTKTSRGLWVGLGKDHTTNIICTSETHTQRFRSTFSRYFVSQRGEKSKMDHPSTESVLPRMM